MKIMHQKIETLRWKAKEANLFVKDYFKIKNKKDPTICIGLPLEEDITHGERLYYRYKTPHKKYLRPSAFSKIKHRINSVFMRGAYIWLSNKIYIFPSFLLNMTIYNITPLLVHEIMHYYQRGSPLVIQNQTTESPVERLATTYAIEGFAVLAEKEHKKQLQMSKKTKIKEDIIKFCGLALIFIASQAVLCAYLFSQLLYLIPQPLKTKFAEFVDKHESFAWLFSWPYNEGYCFAKKLIEKLGPQDAFTLVCAIPPTKLSEIINPEKYLQSKKVEMEMLKFLNSEKN